VAKKHKSASRRNVKTHLGQMDTRGEGAGIRRTGSPSVSGETPDLPTDDGAANEKAESLLQQGIQAKTE
jgi:hypothetical protein